MNKNQQNKTILKNTSMLLLLNMAKLVFPFLTLPYLTRVLSTDCYGTVAYVKAVMSYMQIIVDFGFLLSATKKIVEVKEDKDKLGIIVGNNILAKIMLAAAAGIVLLVITRFVTILKENFLYTYLSFAVVVLTIFLFDFLFRGIERMNIITIRFVIMKGIATLLTFMLVKNDSHYLLIPILEIFGSVVAIVWILFEIKKMGIIIRFSGICDCFNSIRESSVYFLSNIASTSFNVFNTVVLGNVLSPTDIAYWSVCMQIVNAVQALYMPVSDAIYPEMIRSKDYRIVKKIIRGVLPVISAGCLASIVLAKAGLYIVGGVKYLEAAAAFRGLVPVMFFGFLSVLYGWPTLGAIGKIKETTKSTVLASSFQISSVVILLITNRLTLLNMAILRSFTEIILFAVRYFYFNRYKNEFVR